MEFSSVASIYQNRISALEQVIQKLSRQSTWIGRARLLVFILALIWTYSMWNQVWTMAIGLAVILFIFLILVTKSTSVDQELQLQIHLWNINKEEDKILKGQYQHRKSGEVYLSAFDPQINGMTRDLDVFGVGSLFQFINRAMSAQGNVRFANSLVAPNSQDNILKRQTAIRELSSTIDWRQRLMALQMTRPILQETYETLQSWVDNDQYASLDSKWKIIAIVLPVISIGTTGLYATGTIETNVYILLGLLIFGFLGYIAGIASKWFKPLQRIKSELDTLLPCIQTIEKQQFDSAWINDNKTKIILPVPASQTIKTLNKIIARFDYRLNPIVFIPLNFFFCWDLQQVIALNRWRKQFKGNISHWFECLAEMESLSSFANLAFNHPDWTYPLITDTWFTFESKRLAHPLLSNEKAVTNDFILSDPNRMALITGSNMAGKSTFLRSIGANMVLSGAGAPVHAQYFKISPGIVLTSMRISDNLQEETSTFYAELKKIKIIVAAVNAKQRAIILIDEMLRGTNTEDRRIGSHGLVKQLIEHHAVGVIASHDTTLSSFKDLYPFIVKTYYFDSFLDGDEIKFDYTLKPGVCTSANASYLMKKMGIEI